MNKSNGEVTTCRNGIGKVIFLRACLKNKVFEGFATSFKTKKREAILEIDDYAKKNGYRAYGYLIKHRYTINGLLNKTKKP